MVRNNAKCKKQEIMFNIDATYQRAAEVWRDLSRPSRLEIIWPSRGMLYTT